MDDSKVVSPFSLSRLEIVDSKSLFLLDNSAIDDSNVLFFSDNSKSDVSKSLFFPLKFETDDSNSDTRFCISGRESCNCLSFCCNSSIALICSVFVTVSSLYSNIFIKRVLSSSVKPFTIGMCSIIDLILSDERILRLTGSISLQSDPSEFTKPITRLLSEIINASARDC